MNDSRDQTYRQFLRFCLVGLTSNVILFLGYLGITRIGVGPKMAMSTLYGIGVLQTFVFNKKWSFNHKGATSRTFVRYVAAYLCGYFLNLAALAILVDGYELSHRIVQGCMVVFLAVWLFMLQKFWIFANSVTSPGDK
jgi:putative flippase GtrA